MASLVSAKPTPPAARESYAPGPLRKVSDHERIAVQAFLARYPSYEKLSHVELVVMAETYLDDPTRAERDALEEAGVPADWHRPTDEGEEP